MKTSFVGGRASFLSTEVEEEVADFDLPEKRDDILEWVLSEKKGP